MLLRKCNIYHLLANRRPRRLKNILSRNSYGLKDAKATVCSKERYSKVATQSDDKEPKLGWTWTQPEGHDTGMMLRNSYYSERSRDDHGIGPLVVRDPNYVTWYACGPTVYDSSHIGHASTYLHFDLLRRALTTFYGLNICMVMGITNMDNKIINKALLYDRDFMEVSQTYEMEFKRDMENLNILPPTTYVRVTDIIPQIIDFIQDIINKKQAYITEKGNVYYSFTDAHQPVAKLWKEFYEPDETITEKRHVKDTCLWKTAQGGEPYWDSPWGSGRPGWHIECSVMASMCFGGKVDIHSGANDLRFPHHEYEIAQCDAYHRCHQWVNYFLHTGHMRLPDGEKMSKSLGNMITIQECLDQFEERDFLRMLCCGVQWNLNHKYSENAINWSLNNMERFRKFFAACDEVMSGRRRVAVDNPVVFEAIDKCAKDVKSKLDSNFQLRKVMNVLFVLMTTTAKATKDTKTNVMDNTSIVKAANYIKNTLSNLGFTFHLPSYKRGRRV